MKRFLVIFFVLVFVSSVYAACTPGQTTSAPCNAECDGIKIEDKCYDCGADDGVCPRDFNVNCDSYPDCDCNIDKTKPECTGVAAECTICTDCDSFLGLGCNQEECAKCGSCYYLGIISGCESCSTLACEDIAVADCGTKCAGLNCEVIDDACVEKTVTCGNGQLDEGELCDGTKILNDATCDDFGLSGNIICTDTCEFDETSCNSEFSCNSDDALDDGEMCDGEDFISDYDSCEKLGYVSGTLSCSDCVIDDSECSMEEVTDLCAETPDTPQFCLNDDQTEYVCIGEDESCDDVNWGTEEICSQEICDAGTAPEWCVCSQFTDQGTIVGYEEPSQPFPIFTWFNLIITSIIIIGFYVFYRKK